MLKLIYHNLEIHLVDLGKNMDQNHTNNINTTHCPLSCRIYRLLAVKKFIWIQCKNAYSMWVDGRILTITYFHIFYRNMKFS